MEQRFIDRVLIMNKSINTPFTWKITFSFIVLASLIFFLAGWLIITGLIPINLVFNYNKSELNLLRVWFTLATYIGLLLPTITFFFFLGYSKLRLILGLYLFVCIVQLATEFILSRLLFPTIVVMVGSIYSVFRVWQLWQGQQLIAESLEISGEKRRFIVGLLWVMLIFWISNIAVNFAIFWHKL